MPADLGNAVVSTLGSLDVLFADDHIAVVNKPAGLLSCPGRSPLLFDSVQTRVPLCFPRASGSVLVHRLDQPTSGLMVVAMHDEAHVRLQRQFQNRETKKMYHAVVTDRMLQDCGVIELSHRVDIDRRPHQVVDLVHGKASITQYRVVKRAPHASSLMMQPLTGRTHQLRVHAAFGLRAPIAGDGLYGNPRSAERLLLHACVLGLFHPHHGAWMEWTCPSSFGIDDVTTS
jgi:tRNA pseudouridine32 synthase / 23S rRNA pseudouridine746 synthase